MDLSPGAAPARRAPVLDAVAGWMGGWSPAAGSRALRAAIVVPIVLVLSDKVIASAQLATFATFAGFANLVLVTFGGTRRDRAVAHLGLGVVATVLISLGTLVSGHVLLGAIVTVVATFAVLMAGSLGPNLAAGGLAAMVPYLLAATSPGATSVIGSRLAGWWLGTALAVAVVMATASSVPARKLRAALVTTFGTLATEARGIATGVATAESRGASLSARDALRGAFDAAPYRPTGLATVDLALNNLVELAEWATDLLGDTWADLDELALSAGDADLLVAAADVLAAAAELLAGGSGRPDIDQLESLRRQSVEALHHLDPANPDFLAAIHASFHARAVAVATRSIAADALIAERIADPEAIATERAHWLATTTEPATPGERRRLEAVAPRAATILGRHGTLRSVWTRNSARGAVAVTLAVTIADLTNVQHGFWVVLGTLSVLRTTATATSGTAARALLGTTLGVAIGAAIVIAVGTSTAVLWVLFPLVVLVAAYTPGVAPIAAGQAAFTAMLVVLYNLLVPVGWTVGVIRVEDIATGCAISLVAGVLLWPRGASASLSADLVEAFETSASYLVRSVDWALGDATPPRAEGRAALLAALRLDDAVRAFLTEQGSKLIEKDDLWALVGAAQRLRLTAASVAELPHPTAVAVASTLLHERAQVLGDWYATVGEHISTGSASPIAALGPPPHFALTPNASGYYRACQTSVDQHLRHLHLHHSEVIEPAGHLSLAVHRPWWQPSPRAASTEV